MRYCWVQNKNGYVVECSHCKQIQVAFGTSCFTLQLHEFSTLLCNAQKLVEQPSGENTAPVEKTNFMELPANGYYLALTKKELHTFYHLLDAADTERKIFNLQQLIQL